MGGASAKSPVETAPSPVRLAVVASSMLKEKALATKAISAMNIRGAESKKTRRGATFDMHKSARKIKRHITSAHQVSTRNKLTT